LEQVTMRRWPSATIAAVLLSGCAVSPVLRPAAEAPTIPGEERAAAAELGGVRVVLQTDAWRGPAQSVPGTMVLLLSVENGGPAPLLLHLEHLALVDPAGRRMPALPVLEIGSGDLPDVGGSGVSPIEPGLLHHRFLLSPGFAPWSPPMSRFVGPFARDPEQEHTHFQQQPPEGAALGGVTEFLPEGILPSGQVAVGFVYFQPPLLVPDRLTFEARLVDAETGSVIGEVRIPLVVTPP
jgi:hypothetical protein